jgi:transposase
VFVLFYDNAAIHKTRVIRELLEEKEVLAITNCPYSPDLNFCENFIKIHKYRMRKHLDKLKYALDVNIL